MHPCALSLSYTATHFSLQDIHSFFFFFKKKRENSLFVPFELTTVKVNQFDWTEARPIYHDLTLLTREKQKDVLFTMPSSHFFLRKMIKTFLFA
jgi:hypothetical protein